jgi:hypothetical protein
MAGAYRGEQQSKRGTAAPLRELWSLVKFRAVYCSRVDQP